MRAIYVATTLAFFGSAALAAPPTKNGMLRTAGQGCKESSVWGCSVADVQAASEEVLRAAGPLISVSCEARWEESPVDAAYMQRCVDEMRRLAIFLSEKWSATLHPIEPGLIRYDWNKEFGCVDFVFMNGKGGGICPVYGIAKIPLPWHEAAPVTSSAE